MGSGAHGEETYVCLWLIHTDGWQRPTQYCKAIILQFKKIGKRENNKRKKRERKRKKAGGVDWAFSQVGVLTILEERKEGKIEKKVADIHREQFPSLTGMA